MFSKQVKQVLKMDDVDQFIHQTDPRNSPLLLSPIGQHAQTEQDDAEEEEEEEESEYDSERSRQERLELQQLEQAIQESMQQVRLMQEEHKEP
jgi:TATA-binding protein-associated factor Taf7